MWRHHTVILHARHGCFPDGELITWNGYLTSVGRCFLGAIIATVSKEVETAHLIATEPRPSMRRAAKTLDIGGRSVHR